MKKIYKSITLVAAILSLSSCGNDWLDRKPADGIPSEDAITNYNDALTARTGMYDGIQGNSNATSYYGARMFYYGDVRADDMQARTQGMRSSSCYEMLYTVDDAPNMWNIPYNVIRRANRLIEAINEKKVTDATEAQIGKIYSEALVVRALVHFDLVRIYGMPYTADNGASLGVPVIVKPLERNDLPSRNTVAEVYTQVITDLTDAINSGYLAKDQTPGYINEWAAKALLTRVYLTKGDNENALKVAEDIITNSPYKLWTNEEYVNAWYKSNGAHTNEMIFEVVNASNDDWTDRNGYLAKDQTPGYINEWAAKALLTRVYLTKGDNENALKVAEDIITNSPYKLWTNEEYVNAWYKSNGAHTNEMIFEVVNASNDDWTDRNGIAYLLNENGYADAIVTKSFMNMLSQDPKDVRIGMVLPAQYDKDLQEEYGDAKIFINKFPADKDDVGEMRLNNLPLLRLSEVYLSAAEAAAKLGGHQDKAAKYLNEIVQRANPEAKAISEADATVERIILERRKEMIGEGQRYFDALRNNETIVRYKDEGDKGYHYSLIKESQSFDRTYFRAILPIPVDETNVNPNLRAQQNPGY